MLYEKIMSVHNALGALSHRVDKETWAVIKIARNELMDAADMAQEMENFPLGMKAKQERKDEAERSNKK